MKWIILTCALLSSIAFASFSSFAFAKTTDKTDNKIIVEMTVTDKGFQPTKIDAKPGQHLVLNITRKTDTTCATSIQIPSKKIKVDLPLNKTVTVDVGTLEKGEIRFGCAMDMMEGGKIFVQ